MLRTYKNGNVHLWYYGWNCRGFCFCYDFASYYIWFNSFCEFIRSFVCNTKRPSVKQSMKRKWAQNLAEEPSLDDGPPPVNRAWISGRPLHCTSFTTDWPHPSPPIDHRPMADHYTISVSWQTDPTPPPFDQIHGRPLHHISFTYTIMQILGQTCGV